MKDLDFVKQVTKGAKLPLFVSYRFTDTLGTCHHMTKVVRKFDADLMTEGVSIDGSSIAGWRGIENSDMLIMPDWSTAHMDPFIDEPTLAVFCNAVYPDGKPYERCPRTIAARAIDYLKKSGVGTGVLFGPEPEFFIFDSVQWNNEMHNTFVRIHSEEGDWSSELDFDGMNSGHRPRIKGGYFPLQPVDSLVSVRNEMCSKMMQLGLNVELHHHEVATAGQCEIGVECASIVQASDNVQKLKYVVRNVANEFGKTATFMPKPLKGDNGNGMHVHQSISKNGKNIFLGKKYAGLSQEALWYIGGIMKHARALNALTNPSVNSYKRLLPGFEAPTKVAYSARNRSAAVRIPHSADKARRIETRFPDPTANPYLAFAAMLMAGIDGIKNKIEPGEPASENLYHVRRTAEDKMVKNLKKNKVADVCGTLNEALSELDIQRKFLTAHGVFCDDAIDAYLALKWEEVDEFRQAPHPIEFQMYYSR